tara:strand:- start:166 stop:696 length:531 start_codon:yes stop_codon:yes gene_type:complete
MQSITPEVAERYRRVVDLKKAGLTYDQIASELGYADRSGAKRALDAALERWGTESVTSLRMIQNEQIDDLFRRVMTAILEGDLSQVDVAIRLMKRRAELFGLDASKRHEISGLDGGSIKTDVGDMLIARLTELQARQGALTENLDNEPLRLPQSAEGANMQEQDWLEAYMSGYMRE